jgi:uncharacterized protein YyaL (SSP411 family)
MTGAKPAPLPGAPPFEPSLLVKIQAALQQRGASYRPETAHRNPDGSPRFTNRLILETSPYLIQHAHNPVDWRPWGEEAFEAAKQLDRPVLLSVGYSTCHWCHVMEQESFEDEEIARFLNEHFVTIKVDREERPDVDSLYMSAVSALTGGGGWPMTVWLTPEKEPFFGGTYFPARDGDRGASRGLLTILRQTQEAYHRSGLSIQETAHRLKEALAQALSSPTTGSLPGKVSLQKAVESYRSSFDPDQGGLKGAPKFPATLPVRLLLRESRRFPDAGSLSMAVVTLERMADGGIYDQIGGGFHRYATDARWRVPHFEKMLYDNSLLALAYLEGYQATSRAEFARISREILLYLKRDMMSPDGAFYGATDADSRNTEGESLEGLFYTWTPEEILRVLGPERTRVLLPAFGITPGGNFAGGRSIPYKARTIDTLAMQLHVPESEIRSILESSRRDLYQARLNRPAPHRDEKILTAWNGLALSAFSRAAQVLGDEAFLRQAEMLADVLMGVGFQNGRLQRNLAARGARRDAFLSDYAFLTAGLLDLYEATGDVKRLRQALLLDAVLEKHYEDRSAGGFFLTADDAEKLLVREKPSEDGAEPSGNSVAVMNLLRMAELTGEARFLARAELALGAFGAILSERPTSLSEMLLAVEFLYNSPPEIVVVTPTDRQEAVPFLERLRKVYLPNRVLVVSVQGSALNAAATLIPLLSGKTALQGKATAYLCENRTCRLPVTSPEAFEKQLRQLRLPGDNVMLPKASPAQGKP